MDENKIVEVCESCGTAACWYGEFLCGNNQNASTTKITVKELRLTKLENEFYWSDKKMNDIYGAPCPFGMSK